jgi:hypothetical protein
VTRRFTPLFLLLVFGAPLGAQSVQPMGELHPGARVRLDAPGVVSDKFTGTILSSSADTFTVANPSTVAVTVPIAKVTSLQVSRGKSRSAGAVRGLMWGVPIGLVLGIPFSSGGQKQGCTTCDSPGVIIASTTLAGAVWGAGIGAIIGREKWVPLQLRPQH